MSALSGDPGFESGELHNLWDFACERGGAVGGEDLEQLRVADME